MTSRVIPPRAALLFWGVVLTVEEEEQLRLHASNASNATQTSAPSERSGSDSGTQLTSITSTEGENTDTAAWSDEARPVASPTRFSRISCGFVVLQHH